MGKGRLEAFSDGVIAIIITIMVLELKIPHRADLSALWELGPVFLSYVLSFAYVGIYWNNHHHLLHATKHVSGAMLWANLHLLFWLSLFPFTTGWMGENHFATWPVIIYGTNLLLAAMAYTILVRCIIGTHGKDSDIAKAMGSDLKGKVSIAAYLAGIAVAFYNPWISGCLFLAVALMWFIPDRRIERVVKPN
jgi:TMEM175 potassium channel family protein